MSIQKRQLINNETGEAFVPIGHTEATYDANGNTVEQRLTEETQGRQAADIDLQRDVAELQDTTAKIDEGLDPDLAITDESGNAIVKFQGGHVKTKNFDSSGVPQMAETLADLTITDESGNVLAEFSRGHIKTKNFDSSNITNGKKIKILSIGNSFSYDAFSYLPPLLEDIADMDVTFGILFKAGCSLQEHLALLEDDDNYEAYSRYTTKEGHWVQNYLTPKPSTVLASEDWDIIMLQQNSQSYRPDVVPAGYDPYATTIEPYLSDIIDILMGMAHNARITWLLTPSRVYDMDDTFAKTATCAQNIVRDTIIDVVFPCGTAIHNARHTSLDSLGDYAQGGHLTYDGAHLQEGVPCLIESYAAALKILELTGFGEKGIVGNLIRPNSTWLAEKSVIGQNGSPVGVGDSVWEDNRILAQKCAIWAIKKPYEITEDIEPSNT